MKESALVSKAEFYAHRLSEEKLYLLTPQEVVDKAISANPDLSANETKDGGFVLALNGKDVLLVCEFWRLDLGNGQCGSKMVLIDPQPTKLSERLHAALDGRGRLPGRTTCELTFKASGPAVERIIQALCPHETTVPAIWSFHSAR